MLKGNSKQVKHQWSLQMRRALFFILISAMAGTSFAQRICNTSESALSTFRALKKASFERILVDDETIDAKTVFELWADRLDYSGATAEDVLLRTRLLQAATAIDIDYTQHSDVITFPQLVSLRLQVGGSSLTQPVENAIDALVLPYAAGRPPVFIFPLLVRDNIYGNSKQRLNFALKLAKSKKFKNLDFDDIFTDDKYSTAEYDPKDIEDNISRAQDIGVLPTMLSTIACMDRKTKKASIATISDSCCCNNSAHQISAGYPSNSYRKCTSPGSYSGYNCSGATNCVLGSQNCASGHSLH